MEWLGTLLVGIALVVFGGLFMLRHRRLISRLRTEPDLQTRQRDFLIGQQKRRLITSSLVIACGVLLPLAYDATVRQKNVVLASLLLLGILGIALTIVLLGLSDLLSSRSLNTDLELRRAEAELRRRLLEAELEEHRNSSDRI